MTAPLVGYVVEYQDLVTGLDLWFLVDPDGVTVRSTTLRYVLQTWRDLGATVAAQGWGDLTCEEATKAVLSETYPEGLDAAGSEGGGPW